MLDKQITNRAEGEAFLRHLKETGRVFHLEDDPGGILADRDEPLFTQAEAAQVRFRVAELYQLDWDVHGCPIGFLLQIMEY